MTKTWVERNAGPDAVDRVRGYIKTFGSATHDTLILWTGLSRSAVTAACARLACVPAGKGVRSGTVGRFPILWALPKEKRR